MVTYAQAQELAEEWINGGVPRSQQREVRVREFDLGFVCWAVAPADGPDAASRTVGAGGSGEARLVIARDSGASTLWPALPVNEVVRQYEEVYGRPVAAGPAGAAKPAPGPVEATSFLLSPPQWLQEAGAAAIAAEAERLGTAPAGAAAEAPAAAAVPVGAPPAVVPPARAALTEPPVSDRPAGDAPTMLAPPSGHDGPAVAPRPRVPVAAAPPVPAPAPAGDEAGAVLMSEGLRTTGSDLPEAAGSVGAEAATMLMPPTAGGPGLPPVPPSAARPPVAPPLPPAPAPAPAPAAEPAPTLLAPPDAMPGLMGLPGAPAAPPVGGPQVEHAPTMLAPPGVRPAPDLVPDRAGQPAVGEL
ncbi:hypothetical protein ACFRMQ_34625, partial [Kitasatospora sp. NPDC056783]